jgi:proline iminopeptidase
VIKIAVDDVDLAYTDSASGRPLICLHGGMGIDGASLRVPGILDLAAFGIRVIVPDQRGHGDSGRSDPALYSHDRWAADIAAFAARLGLPRFALLGHSYGGFLALEYAIRWPHTLSHLVLVGTSAGPVRSWLTPVNSGEELAARFESTWPQLFAGADKHWELFRALRFDADAYNAAFTRELPRYDLRNRAVSIDLPALLIVGERDHYRGDMEWLAARMPAATLHIVDQAGHLPFVERPDAFTAAVASFLTSSPASRRSDP